MQYGIIINTLIKELPEGCAVIRMGGDEFMILCNGISEEKAIGFMNNIRESLKEKANRRMYEDKKKLKYNNVK